MVAYGIVVALKNQGFLAGSTASCRVPMARVRFPVAALLQFNLYISSEVKSMDKEWSTKVEARKIEVKTYIPVRRGIEWEMQFFGPEVENALKAGKIPDVVITLWDVDDDPEGSNAEKLHNIAVALLQRNMLIQEVFNQIKLTSEQIIGVLDEEERIKKEEENKIAKIMQAILK